MKPAASTDPAALVAAGKASYQRHCASCHHANPAQDGALGPAVAGASLELLDRRIVFGDYPPGHAPKRPSRTMVALPHVKKDIPALHAYLNSF